MALYEIIAPKGSRIVTLEDWREHAPPKSPYVHWKDGRSAKEFAKYVLLNDGINKLLEDLGISYDGVLLCYPEHVTGLPGSGFGRHHDLLIVSENGNLLICVEAKTDEDLGNYCKNIKNPTENKKRRLMYMRELVFKKKDFDCLEFRYQLLTAAAGTMLEAKHYVSKQVYFVVFSFEKKGYKYSKLQICRTKTDFENFGKVLSSISPELNLRYLHKNID